jgi:nucleoside phosphorylase
MKVLVTFAVDAEFAPWRQFRHFEKESRREMQFFSARVADSEVIILLTGIGAKKIKPETMRTVFNDKMDVCISSGLAGALKSEYHLADILAAQRIDSGNGKSVACDQSLLAIASEAGAKIVTCFHTADHVVLDAQEKQELGKTADAVEMESADILSSAKAMGAKIIAVRGISDLSSENLPLDFNRVTTDSGEVSISRVLVELARRPQSMPALIRFGRNSRMAAEKLCRFLDVYVSKVISAERVLKEEVVTAR